MKERGDYGRDFFKMRVSGGGGTFGGISSLGVILVAIVVFEPFDRFAKIFPFGFCLQGVFGGRSGKSL